MKRTALIAVHAILTMCSVPAAADEEREAGESATSAPGAALTGSYGVVNSNHAEVVRAIELHAVAAPVGKTYFGVVAGVAEGMSTAVEHMSPEARSHIHYDHAYWDVSLGPQIAWGAPYRASSRWGLALRIGASAGTRDVTLYSAFGDHAPARYLSPFGAASVRIALCKCQSLRPFTGVSGRWVLSQFGDSVQSATIDLGLAFAP